MATEAQRLAPARPRPKREREEEVLVWPHLVFIEFISAVLFTVTFLIVSVFINAPLLNRANLNVTPNPSKAPWYFLNLQELLLHMDAAWAGVLVPTIALIFFAVEDINVVIAHVLSSNSRLYRSTSFSNCRIWYGFACPLTFCRLTSSGMPGCE